MKFLAILGDSLREALDAKVIYVTLALSALVVAVCATFTFTPRGGANASKMLGAKVLMQFAAWPLNVDIANIDINELRMQGGGPNPLRFAGLLRGSYSLASVTPVGGEEWPDATYHVTLQVGGGPVPGLEMFLGGRKKPEQAMAEIRERFGRLDDAHLAEVLDVTPGEKPDTYVVTARFTPQGRKLWPHDLSLFFGLLPIPLGNDGAPLGAQLYAIENLLLNYVGAWVVLLIGVVLTAFFIPNMLRKGTVDLLIVKPMPRYRLLVYKYVGGLLFVLLNTAVAVGGVWLVLAVRSGIWAPGVLVAIPAITFFFAILYSVSTLAGVVTRSAIVAIMVTCAAWFFLFLAGMTYAITDEVTKEAQARARRAAVRMAGNAVALGPVPGGFVLAATRPLARPNPFSPGPALQEIEHTPGWFVTSVRAIRFVLPRTGDLTTLVNDRLQGDLMGLPRVMRAAAQVSDSVSWVESLTVSGVFIAAMLGLACWWFSTKDY